VRFLKGKKCGIFRQLDLAVYFEYNEDCSCCTKQTFSNYSSLWGEGWTKYSVMCERKKEGYGRQGRVRRIEETIRKGEKGTEERHERDEGKKEGERLRYEKKKTSPLNFNGFCPSLYVISCKFVIAPFLSRWSVDRRLRLMFYHSCCRTSITLFPFPCSVYVIDVEHY
jgi:hypothetical protein